MGPRRIGGTLLITLLVMAASNSAISYLGVMLAGTEWRVGVGLCLVPFGVAGALAGGLVVDAGGPSWRWIVPVAGGVPAVAGYSFALRRPR